MTARQECRLKLRKGEPVSYYIHTCTTFLDLSREIRGQIYLEAFTSPDPISVCSIAVDSYEHHFVHDIEAFKDDEGRIVHEDRYIIDSRDDLFKNLAFGLLRTSRIIASEAAYTFYRANTFHFGGSYVWNPLYGWLDQIGRTNRSYLRSISLNLVKPQKLQTNELGIRTLGHRSNFRRQIVVSCLPSSKDPLEFVDPAIEACFRMLGMHNQQVELKIFLAKPFLPGINVWLPNPETYELELRPWLSLDVPENIEQCRATFASNVDVVWFGKGRKDMFWKHAKEIQEKGWDVLETRESHFVSPPFYDYWEIYFVLRRSYPDSFTNSRSWLRDGFFGVTVGPG